MARGMFDFTGSGNPDRDLVFKVRKRREGGKEGRREGGKEGRREGGKREWKRKIRSREAGKQGRREGGKRQLPGTRRGEY
jgi:hypothetical protein